MPCAMTPIEAKVVAGARPQKILEFVSHLHFRLNATAKHSKRWALFASSVAALEPLSPSLTSRHPASAGHGVKTTWYRSSLIATHAMIAVFHQHFRRLAVLRTRLRKASMV